MAPRTAEKFGKMRESARKKIMDAALEVFAAEGYHRASISQIARNAGVSKGLMYNYFTSKEELLRAIIFSGIESLTFSFDPDHDGELTRNEMAHFIRETVSMVKAHPIYWKLYFQVVYQSSAIQLFYGELRELANNYMAMTERYFTNLQFENPHVEARLFNSMLDGVFINYLYDIDTFPIDEIREKIVKMYS